MRRRYWNITHKARLAKRISMLRHSFPYSALWTVWTAAIMATGAYQWYHDVGHQHSLNVVALVLHCLLVGGLGIILVEDIAFWLEDGECSLEGDVEFRVKSDEHVTEGGESTVPSSKI